MAFPTAVNDQVTDAVSQADTGVVGDAPAFALGSLYQAASQAMSNAAHNASSNQQNVNITSQAATTVCLSKLNS